jgi:DNA invertase Pin-like site-specific DNA recombinase
MWWQKKKPEIKAKAVAYCRHSAQDRQENSIPIQKEQIFKFAQEHGIEIIKVFEDPGKSGLTAEERDSFNEMLDFVVNSKEDFQYILALDVSRWGRFQNVDLSAYYRQLCQQYGKQVIFTSHGMPKGEDDLMRYMRLVIEGYQAAHYSRELSDKVFKGCIKVVEQGYRAGGNPPYGLRRLLLDEKRNPVQILERGQRKSIQNQRVTLTPGDPVEMEIINRIFTEFASRQKTPIQIAASLNEEGIPSPSGSSKWSGESVLSILKNDLYIGTMVYNKTSQKLKSPSKQNPESEWIRRKEAFQNIVDKKLFQQVQTLFKQQEEEYRQKYSQNDMITKLQKLYETRGIITARQIGFSKDMLSPAAYTRCFQSLDRAFQKMFSPVLDQTICSVVDQLALKARKIEEFEDYYVVNDSFSILIQPSVPVPYGYQVFWAFYPDARLEVDITLGIPLSNDKQYQILGYVVFPRLLVKSQNIRLFSSSEGKLEFYAYSDLRIIDSLLSL